MKTELNNAKKIRIPYSLINGNKVEDPCGQLGAYLKAVLDTEHRINVSKIWINQETDKKLDAIIIDYCRKVLRMTKARAEREIGMYKLAVGPAMDFNDSFQLDTDYIYVEEDFAFIEENV